MNKEVKISASNAHSQRFIIVDSTTGVVIDDAQGFGFRTMSNAETYADAQGWNVLNREVIESEPLF